MTPYEIIIKKRDGGILDSKEIDYFIKGCTNNVIPDYQISAFLMAVFFRGLSTSETVDLTKAIINSGKKPDFTTLDLPLIDKHSTGGVGDKISLILAPLASSLGINVPMVCGRGLGHTGGTIDKFESIPGFRTNHTLKGFSDQIHKINVAIAEQSQEFVPADRKLYSIRDVTGTVESIPLIAASIMSKKIAEGIEGLILDIKTGSGAFITSIENAKILANTMIEIGNELNIRTSAFLTNMDQPLGNAVGNTLELIESIEVLKGKGPDDVRQLSVHLTAQMLHLAYRNMPFEECLKKTETNLDNGTGYKKFIQIVQEQGGDVQYIEQIDKFPKPKIIIDVLCELNGYISYINTREIGLCSTLLGAGRIKLNDHIDHASGIIIKKKLGTKISIGEPLCTIYTNKNIYQHIIERLKDAFTISSKYENPQPLIIEQHGYI